MDNKDLLIIKKIEKYFSESPIIFDVGANKGDYSSYIVNNVKWDKLFLFEPIKVIYDVTTIRFANYENIKITNTLVSDIDGVKQFYYFHNNHNEISSCYDRPVFKQCPDKIVSEISSIKLDTFMGNNNIDFVDFVKIDTEGAEYDVLKGTIESLKSKKINFLQVEYGETYSDIGITFREIIKFCNDLGYKTYSLDGDNLKEETYESFIEDYHYDNFLITNQNL